MNKVIETILTRRSTRKFKNNPVPKEMVEEIIKCGLNSPSSKNAQPWRFHIVTDKEVLGSIADTVNNPYALASKPFDPKTGLPNEKFVATVKESAEIVKSAPLAIFIENTSPFMGGKMEVINSPHATKSIDGLQFEVMGIGCSVENILLAAHSLGLGGVFMGDLVIEEPKIKEILGFSGDYIGVIVIGYSDQDGFQDKVMKDDRVVYH